MRYSLSHLLCALFDVCFRALNCASPLDRLPHHNHDSSSCPNTQRECGDRASRVRHSGCCVSHSCSTAPIRNHIAARAGHSCQGRNDRTSQKARGDGCKLAHTARHRLSVQNLRAKIARIFFRAAANHIELSFTQCLLVPQVTRLQMSHPTRRIMPRPASESVRIVILTSLSGDMV